MMLAPVMVLSKPLLVTPEKASVSAVPSRLKATAPRVDEPPNRVRELAALPTPCAKATAIGSGPPPLMRP